VQLEVRGIPGLKLQTGGTQAFVDGQVRGGIMPASLPFLVAWGVRSNRRFFDSLRSLRMTTFTRAQDDKPFFVAHFRDSGTVAPVSIQEPRGISLYRAFVTAGAFRVTLI